MSKAPAVYAGLLCSLSLWIFAKTLAGLAALAWRDERYSYILVVPFLSALLLYLRKNLLRRDVRPAWGVPLAVLGLVLRYAPTSSEARAANAAELAFPAAGLVLMWLGTFLLCYGRTAFRASVFPLALLLLLVPLPESVMHHVVRALQTGSAELSYFLFRLLRVPVMREGFLFSLPGVQIEITEQCSSIRSSISLLLASLLAGHILVELLWRKVSLAVLAVAIAIFQNAVRIVILSSLGIYVNPQFLYGSLHRYGGVVFSFLGLAMLGGLLCLLRSAPPPRHGRLWLR